MNNVETVAYELYAELERKLERAESALAGAVKVNTRHALEIRDLKRDMAIKDATIESLGKLLERSWQRDGCGGIAKLFSG